MADLKNRRVKRTIYGVRKVGDGDKAFWTPIGACFVNGDGSENLVFNYFPTDPTTTIQIRDDKEKEGQ